MAGVPELPITFLRDDGELVDTGEIVAEFHAAEQEYNLFSGRELPRFQLGDTARPGQVVARIPDMSRWEAGPQLPETDGA